MKTFKETGYNAITLEDWLLFLNNDPYVKVYDEFRDQVIWSGNGSDLFGTWAADITEFTVELYEASYGITVLVNVNLEGKGIK